MRKVIFNLIIEHHGNWSKVYDAILNKEKPTLPLNFEDWQSIYENSIFISDDNYFDKFKKMYMPPFALFYDGNINLINKKVFGILGNIKNTNLEDLKSFRDKNYVICLIRNDVDNNIINQLIEQKFKLIILCDKKLDYSDIKSNKNIVYISEYCTNKIDIDNQQILKRLLYAISDDIFIESKSKDNIDIILENSQNEIKNCFMFYDDHFSKNIIDMLDKKLFKSIKYLNEIIDFNKT